MKKLELVKTGVGLVASVGVGAIVGNAIKATTPSDIKTISKLCVAVGSLVLTGILGDMASKYTDDQIDSMAETVRETINVEKTGEEVDSETEVL